MTNRRLRVFLCVSPLMAAAFCACSDELDRPEGLSKITTFGGPIVYPNVEVAQLGPDSLQMAVVPVGRSPIELVTYDDGARSADAQYVTPPDTCSSGFPVAIAAGDLDGDDHVDLGVIDPTCGNWMRLDVAGAMARSVAWSEVATDVVANRTLRLEDLDNDGRVDVLTGNSQWSRVEFHSQTTEPRGVTLLGPQPFVSEGEVTEAVISFRPKSSGRADILYQGAGIVARYEFASLDVANGDMPAPALLPQTKLEYLVPFSGFDHLTPFDATGCSGLALGVGLFPQAAGHVPRQLQLLTMNDPSGYVVRELDVGLDEVTTFRLAPNKQHLVAIGTLDGEGALSLLELSGCVDARPLGAFTIEFDWQTIASHYPDRPRLPKTSGVKFALFQRGPRLIAVHYDGFDVRAFRLEQDAAGAWTLEQITVSIHGADSL